MLIQITNMMKTIKITIINISIDGDNKNLKNNGDDNIANKPSNHLKHLHCGHQVKLLRLEEHSKTYSTNHYCQT